VTNCRSLVQKDLDKLEDWANRKLNKFNEEKRQVLLLDLSVSVCHYRLGRDWLSSSFVEKAVGLWWISG